MLSCAALIFLRSAAVELAAKPAGRYMVGQDAAPPRAAFFLGRRTALRNTVEVPNLLKILG